MKLRSNSGLMGNRSRGHLSVELKSTRHDEELERKRARQVTVKWSSILLPCHRPYSIIVHTVLYRQIDTSSCGIGATCSSKLRCDVGCKVGISAGCPVASACSQSDRRRQAEKARYAFILCLSSLRCRTQWLLGVIDQVVTGIWMKLRAGYPKFVLILVSLIISHARWRITKFSVNARVFTRGRC